MGTFTPVTNSPAMCIYNHTFADDLWELKKGVQKSETQSGAPVQSRIDNYPSLFMMFSSTLTFLSLHSSLQKWPLNYSIILLVSKGLTQTLIFKLVLFKSTGRPEVNKIPLCISFSTYLSILPNRDRLLKWGFMICRKAFERRKCSCSFV